MSNLQLEGKVAVVTGGSRGLGREMVLGFAEAGADVMIVSRKLDSCEELAAQVRESTGRRAVAFACHMGDWAAQDGLVERAYEEFGRVDILVNNAGMSPLYSSLDEISEDLYDKVMAVNLKGPFRLTALVGKRMAEGDGGSIINISSIAAERPTPGDLPYAAAKSGLNILTKGFAQAYGPKVRVNAIMAGPFLTDISKAWDMDQVAERMQAYPLRRAGNPNEIVGAALYLAGDASSYTTGALLPVDGGRIAKA
ncbi:SDR family NAD(P)-dependent oxidoreductase [Rhodococcus sp. ARC_M6]|uniref:SDR family NAD(P)-dependent oxidoreductase n=1 Tax=Rhodococcus sp. ARC_M6 TaxID=2928852 RepID=UPI001FB2AB9D|nr:SDR family oxidoreductase [Rhodococcus sp. ARC_M6]MCJ0905440.1 SDR family oxidoreductase [Rhodococcus sp. ARC_M6]